MTELTDLTVVKLAARLPAGERNGLDALAAQVAHKPEGTFAVLLMVDVDKTTTTILTGETTAMLRIRRAEAISREDFPEVERLLRRALERRTGQPMLPEHIEVEITQAFHADEADHGGPDG